MATTKVLMTGAAGYIASQLLPTFRARYDLVLVDVTQKDRQGEEVKDIVVLDLIDPDRSKYAQYFEGVDAVVHLGYKRRSGPHPLDHFFDLKQHAEVTFMCLVGRSRNIPRAQVWQLQACDRLVIAVTTE